MRLRLFSLMLFISVPIWAFGQAITPQGTPTTLDVATWNIEWFGNSSNGPSDDELQFQNVKRVIAEADIDLWAVQEIANRDLFGRLTQELGDGYEGILATNSGTQRIGFVYNPDIIRPRQVRHILTNRDFAGRPPLQLEANVTLPDTTVIVTFIVVHMKAFSDFNSYTRRVAGARDLKNHIDFTSLASQAVVLLGDFNDRLDGSITFGQTSPFAPFISDTDNYFAPTLRLDQNNVATFCGNSTLCSGNSTIDHIVVSNELADAYITDSSDRYGTLLQEVSGYVFNTSDHMPVYARFGFDATGVHREHTEQPLMTARLHAAYPNPFSYSTTLSVDVPTPQHTQLVVFDVMGREVQSLANHTLASGTHTFAVDATHLSAGTYFVRLQTATHVKTQTLVVLQDP